MPRYLLILSIIMMHIYSTGQSCDNGLLKHYNYEDIKVIFDANQCQTCHASPSNKWSYESYESFLGTSTCYPSIINRGDAGQSHLLDILTGSSTCIDSYKEEHTLTGEAFKAIEMWINVGAPQQCIPTLSEVNQVFEEQGCYSCHNASTNAGQLDLTSTSFIGQSSISSCSTASIVELYRPEGSTLWSAVSGDPCVPNHSVLDEIDLIKIRDWIGAGAPLDEFSLPLELIEFDLLAVESHPLLTWKTASEQGVLRMDIERRNTNGRFEIVASINPTGMPTNSYEYVDVDVSYGSYIYRINIVDYDGRHEYSPLRQIDLSAPRFIFNAFPNPATGRQQIMLEWYSKNDIQETAKMKLMTSHGAVITEYRIKAGYNTFTLPDLQEGIYYLTVSDYYGGTHFERILITK